MKYLQARRAVGVPTRWQPPLLALLACVVLAAVAAHDLWRERQMSVAHARTATANIAQLLAAAVQRAMDDAVQQLQDAARGLAAAPTAASLPAARPAATGAELPLLQALWWLPPGAEGEAGAGWVRQADGRLQALSPSQQMQARHALQRPDWRPLLAGAGPELGAPERQDDGRWRTPLRLALRAADGRSHGLLVGWLAPQQLDGLLQGIDTGRHGFVTLFHRGGWVLATAPTAGDELMGRNWLATPMFAQHLPAAPLGTVQQVVVRDGAERIYSWRTLPDPALVVAAGLSLTEALADWRDRVRSTVLLLGAVAAALLGAALWLARHHRRREAAEQRLADAARQTQAIVDHIADAVLAVDGAGRVHSVNLAAQTLFGQPASGLVGRPVADLVPALAPRPAGAAGAIGAMGPVEPPAPRPRVAATRADGAPLTLEVALTLTRHDGDGDAPLQVALLRDVTAHLQAEAVLAEARAQTQARERFLRALTDTIPVRIAYVDDQRRVRFANQAWLDSLGLPREAVLGRALDGLAERPAQAQALTQALAGQRQTASHEEPLPDGGRAVVESASVPDRGADGQVRGAYLVSTDVSARHQQQRRLEQALAERETLLREVYHRVKNNLQVVQSLLNLQRRALADGPVRAALDDSVQRVRAMALVHEKLYQTGTLASVALPDYTQELLRQIADAADASRRGIVVRGEVAALEVGLEASVPFGLLVTELVGNSLKHGFADGRRGTIQLRLRLQPPTGSGAVGPAAATGQADQTDTPAPPGEPELEVADDGAGLPPGFDLGGTRSLGLQLAVSLAEQLGGSLRAEPLDGGIAGAAAGDPARRGTVFRARLPRLLPPRPAVAPPAPGAQRKPAAPAASLPVDVGAVGAGAAPGSSALA